MSPWEGSDPGDGWERPWGPGASLSYMEILAGPEWLCPSAKWGVRPQTDEMLSGWNSFTVVCRYPLPFPPTLPHKKFPPFPFPFFPKIALMLAAFRGQAETAKGGRANG